jgi:hypothetical protein
VQLKSTLPIINNFSYLVLLSAQVPADSAAVVVVPPAAVVVVVVVGLVQHSELIQVCVAADGHSDGDPVKHAKKSSYL